MTPLRTPSLLAVCDGRSPLARAIVALTNSTTNAAIRVVVFILPSFLKAEPPSVLSQDNK